MYTCLCACVHNIRVCFCWVRTWVGMKQLDRSLSSCCSVAKLCPALCNPVHARLSCPSLSPGLCSNSCPLTVMPSNYLILCCSLLLLSSIFDGTGVFSNKSVLNTSGGQSIGASALASVLPINIPGGFPLGLTVLILLLKGLSRVFSSTTV